MIVVLLLATAAIVVGGVLVSQSKAGPVVAPHITYHQPYVGFVGRDYNWSVDANLGSPVAKFSISAGQLPPGLELNVNTGGVTVNGTATKIGSYKFVLKADNGKTEPTTVTYVIKIVRDTDPSDR